MANDEETSEGGSKILRHVAEDRPHGVADMDEQALEAIDAHLKKHIGKPASVFHEIVSDIVHIDVHIIEPSPERDCYTLVTTGMSDLPMNAPPGAEDFRYAELLLSLPKDWTPGPLLKANMEDERLYWPIRLLKTLARLPHQYNTWLAYGHTVPNGDPAEPYADNTQLCCGLVLPAVGLPIELGTLHVRPDKAIHFYGVYPIYESEMHYKLKNGTDALVDCLFKAGVTELLDPKRPLAAKKKRFLFF